MSGADEGGRRLGAVLLALGFGLGAVLDVASATEGAAAGWELRTARLTQVGLFRMALLQFLWIELARAFDLTGSERAIRGARVVALAYAVCELTRIARPDAGALTPWLALAHAAIALRLFVAARRHPNPLIAKTLTATVAMGFLVDAGVALVEWRPELLPAYFGGIDDVRLRMLRLARVAAIVLPLLLALHVELRAGVEEGARGHTWSWRAARIGSVGMPLMLVLTALTFVARKGPLFITTLEMMAATAWSASFAGRQGRLVERRGWRLVLGSMVVGLGLSAFAFGGPFPVPEALGPYAHLPRALVRVAHVYGIVLGVLWVLRARGHLRVAAREGALAVAAAVTLAAPLAVAAAWAPPIAQAVGPTLVALTLLAGCWRAPAPPAPVASA